MQVFNILDLTIAVGFQTEKSDQPNVANKQHP